MSYIRSEIRTEVRDAFYEDVADLITDNQLNRFISQEIRSLPRKGIYLEEIHTTNTEVDKLDYPLPANTYKIEKVERNWGTNAKPNYEEIKGWDIYGSVLWFNIAPTSTFEIRIHIKKKFTVLTDDVAASDVPDDEMEVVIVGVMIRAYRSIMGYLRDANNYDSVIKPNGISMSQIQAWYTQAKQDYKELIRQYAKSPRPRDIDLVG